MSRMFQLAGPTGSGKTRLLSVLADVSNPAGMELRQILLPLLSATSTSLLPQGIRRPVFSRAVRSLLTVPLVYAGSSLTEAEAKVRALLNRFSFGYLLNRDYFTLSGGERQFVGLFSTLMWDVDAYLLDDPIAMLDQKRAAETVAVLNEYSQGEERGSFVLATSNIESHAGLQFDETVHVGYCPDVGTCARQLESLLARESCALRGETGVDLDSLTVAPFGRRLVSDQTLHLGPGRLFLLTGNNGEGKTCLLHTLGGLRSPTAGRVRLRMGDVESAPAAGETALYFPQEPAGLLGFGSVREELGAGASPLWWTRILEFFYDWQLLDPAAHGTEGSFGEVRFRSVLAMIGGAARSKKTRILLFDEPDVSLDDLRAGSLAALLGWLVKGGFWTCVTTHRPQLYKACCGPCTKVTRLSLADKELRQCDL